jgi:tRNA-dihydrouridine synthase B
MPARRGRQDPLRRRFGPAPAMNPIRIGRHVLSSQVVLAPMAGVTDRPFRALCRQFGAGLAASEMLTSDTRLWDTEKSQRRMDIAGEASPRVVQIAGYDAAMMAEAAQRNADAGADIIDINMGCPAKKVCNRQAGSALMQDEALVAQILERVVRAVAVPVTLKTRTGWDREHKNGIRIATLAEQCGIQALAIHGRTRADMYQGDAEHETVRAIKESHGFLKMSIFFSRPGNCAQSFRYKKSVIRCASIWKTCTHSMAMQQEFEWRENI